MTDRDFQADRRVCEAVPDGTLTLGRVPEESDTCIIGIGSGFFCRVVGWPRRFAAESFARFFVAARIGWPAALDRIDELERQDEEKQGQLLAAQAAGRAVAESADKLQPRLDEIDAGCKADQADLDKMRDGTKLTRSGLVMVIVYQQQEMSALAEKLAKAKAEAAAMRKALVGLRDVCDDSRFHYLKFGPQRVAITEALAPTTGTALLDRMKKLEVVAEAAELYRHAAGSHCMGGLGLDVALAALDAKESQDG